MSDTFIQLFKNDFCSAKTLGRLGFENIIQDTNILMFPNETFLQVTNLNDDIAFAGNIQVDLIDAFENVVLNLIVNVNFFYTEFTDYNGIKQIAFEFGNLNQDFYNQNLYLRLTHTFALDVWYSNAFNMSFYQGIKSTRFDYASEDSETFYLKSIRLKSYLNDQNSKAEQKEYTTLLGNVISERKIITPVNAYKMYCCNFFDYERLDGLFANDIIYVDGTRISNKPNLKKGERLGDSNFFDLDFETTPTKEKYNFVYQLFEEFRLVSTSLISGVYSLAYYNDESNNGNVFLNFNKIITDTTGLVIKVYKNGVLNEEITTFVVSANQISFNINSSTVGVYDIIIAENLIYSGIETFEGLKLNVLKYTIQDGQFKADQFNNDQFITN